MKVLAQVHKYPPTHNAGAEMMLHAILRWMVGRDHDVHVLVAAGEHDQHEGIPLTVGRHDDELYRWADVVLTHLDLTPVAARAARRHDRPLVHLVHNHRQLRYHRVRPPDAALVVFNSEWLQRAVPWRGESIVVRPPVFAEEYRTKRSSRNATTLINLLEAKGAPLFWELARRLPERRFIAVKGAYGYQEVPAEVPRNVEVRDNDPDIRSVYRDTRVLLMPSAYESWGRCAVEAAASGIPTIANATPGLLEALGPAGIFCDPNVLEDWAWALGLLDDHNVYEHASGMARARSRRLDPMDDLLTLEKALLQVAETGRQITGTRS